MADVWLRTARATAIDVGGDVVLLGRTVRRLSGDSAELARAVLAFLTRPHTRAELIAHIASLADGATEPIASPRTRTLDIGEPAAPRAGGDIDAYAAVIDELLALLAEAGAIAAPPAMPPRAPAHNVVACVCGALAASHAPALVAALQRRGHAVEVALTSTAARFVAVDALGAIAQREIHTSMWPRAAYAPVPHVALAQWADVVLVYPASATTIARLAVGDFSDLVSAIALTTRAPVVIVPSMNADMIEAPAVARNLERLRADGHAIVHGVPSLEAADAPAARTLAASAAPPPAEVAAALDALLLANALRRRGATTRRDWDEAYRALGRTKPAWLKAPVDADIADALAAHAPVATRTSSAPSAATLLDIGTGLGTIARHAAERGYRVVATDVSDVALAMAKERGGDVVWLRDDICATALAGPFDVIVDRGVLHVLSRERAHAWAASVARLLAPGGVAIVKCHAAGVPDATSGWTAEAIAAMAGLAVVEERATTLPHPREDRDEPARLIVLRRRRAPEPA